MDAEVADLTFEKRLARLDALDEETLRLLVSYLDGREPRSVDDWFAKRHREK